MECTQLVDLIFFMGQSNMAGRGDAALAPAVTPGMGFEYRAVTDPAQLHPWRRIRPRWQPRSWLCRH